MCNTPLLCNIILGVRMQLLSMLSMFAILFCHKYNTLRQPQTRKLNQTKANLSNFNKTPRNVRSLKFLFWGDDTSGLQFFLFWFLFCIFTLHIFFTWLCIEHVVLVKIALYLQIDTRVWPSQHSTVSGLFSF